MRKFTKRGLSVLLTVAIVASMIISGGLIASADSVNYSSMLSVPVGSSTSTATVNGVTLTKTIIPVIQNSIATDMFDINLKATGVTGTTATEPTDIVLLIDSSSSMDSSKVTSEVTAATTFINNTLNNANSSAKISVVEFSGTATAYKFGINQNNCNYQLYNDSLSYSDYFVGYTDIAKLVGGTGTDYTIHNAIKDIQICENSNLQGGIHVASQVLSKVPIDHKKILIVMTSGETNACYFYTGINDVKNLNPPFTFDTFYANYYYYLFTGFDYSTQGSYLYNDISAISEAYMLQQSATIFTIRFGSSNDNGPKYTLKNIASRKSFTTFYDRVNQTGLTAGYTAISTQLAYPGITVSDDIGSDFKYVSLQTVPAHGTTAQPLINQCGGTFSWSAPSLVADDGLTYRVRINPTVTNGDKSIASSTTFGVGSCSGTLPTQPFVRIGTGSIKVIPYLVNANGKPITSSGILTTGTDDAAKKTAAAFTYTANGLSYTNTSPQTISSLNLGTAYSVPSGLTTYNAPNSTKYQRFANDTS